MAKRKNKKNPKPFTPTLFQYLRAVENAIKWTVEEVDPERKQNKAYALFRIAVINDCTPEQAYWALHASPEEMVNFATSLVRKVKMRANSHLN
jgi:hypothetical protein